ncbi:MAG: hypothetical protein KatS3mg105_3795 [Gemmatales bacterium]|nr:MAG: hypothetical protein KatS3mg105_3795 [Gemmatales bacterium]
MDRPSRSSSNLYLVATSGDQTTLCRSVLSSNPALDNKIMTPCAGIYLRSTGLVTPRPDYRSKAIIRKPVLYRGDVLPLTPALSPREREWRNLLAVTRSQGSLFRTTARFAFVSIVPRLSCPRHLHCREIGRANSLREHRAALVMADVQSVRTTSASGCPGTNPTEFGAGC